MARAGGPGMTRALILALVGLLCAEPAWAQAARCAPRDAVLKELKKRYAEGPVGVGLTARGNLLEILASPSGSWTLIVTVPGGPTCLVNSGESWRPVAARQDEPNA